MKHIFDFKPRHLESKEPIRDPSHNDRPQGALGSSFNFSLRNGCLLNSPIMIDKRMWFVKMAEATNLCSKCATFGIALAGSLRSPERLAPATIPVTAVKKTPKVSMKAGSC